MVSQYAMLAGTADPPRPQAGLYLFLGEHGIAEEGVTDREFGYAAKVKADIVAGASPVIALAAHNRVTIEIQDCSPQQPCANFLKRSSLLSTELDSHLELGAKEARQAAAKYTVVGVGSAGAGSSTAAAAMTGALLELNAVDVTGKEAGQSVEGFLRKLRVVERGLTRHQGARRNGRLSLEAFGGHEMARMCGFLLGAADCQLPVVLDGFVTAAAALAAIRQKPALRNYLFYSHRSPEPGHRYLLDAMAVDPVFDLEIRHGQGIGALLALGLLDAGWLMYSQGQSPTGQKRGLQ